MSRRERPTLEEILLALGRPGEIVNRAELVSSPLLAALQQAGTSHVYADTADIDELGELLSTGKNRILAEVDGNTANQPLVGKVIGHCLDCGNPREWGSWLRALLGDINGAYFLPLMCAIACGRVGNDFVYRFASGRSWEVSLPLHMGLCSNPEAAKQVARYLKKMVPTAFVTVPFTPHYPHCLLVARDLGTEGIPVNFTSTFSARQAVAAGLLGDATRANIFMGRINQGLNADLLGEHVDLEAQRALLELRREAGIKTQLIVASMREWQTFVRTAGCDVYTAPVGVIRDFLNQGEVSPEEIRSQLQASYEGRLGIAPATLAKLGREPIARFYRVEPELVEFLKNFRGTADYRNLGDGEHLFRRFEEAGFGDLFYAPSESEWSEIRRDKIPDLESSLTARLPLDTLYSLLADADFEKHQEEMDREISERLSL
jgi:transaldolase